MPFAQPLAKIIENQGSFTPPSVGFKADTSQLKTPKYPDPSQDAIEAVYPEMYLAGGGTALGKMIMSMGKGGINAAGKVNEGSSKNLVRSKARNYVRSQIDKSRETEISRPLDEGRRDFLKKSTRAAVGAMSEAMPTVNMIEGLLKDTETPVFDKNIIDTAIQTFEFARLEFDNALAENQIHPFFTDTSPAARQKAIELAQEKAEEVDKWRNEIIQTTKELEKLPPYPVKDIPVKIQDANGYEAFSATDFSMPKANITEYGLDPVLDYTQGKYPILQKPFAEPKNALQSYLNEMYMNSAQHGYSEAILRIQQRLAYANYNLK